MFIYLCIYLTFIKTINWPSHWRCIWHKTLGTAVKWFKNATNCTFTWRVIINTGVWKTQMMQSELICWTLCSPKILKCILVLVYCSYNTYTYSGEVMPMKNTSWKFTIKYISSLSYFCKCFFHACFLKYFLLKITMIINTHSTPVRSRLTLSSHLLYSF